MLMSKSRAWAEIDLSRIAHNVEEVRALIPATSKIMGIVKADAYGHGAVECTRALEACGVDFFGVSSVDEAVELREHGIPVDDTITTVEEARDAILNLLREKGRRTL